MSVGSFGHSSHRLAAVLTALKAGEVGRASRGVFAGWAPLGERFGDGPCALLLDQQGAKLDADVAHLPPVLSP